MNLIDLQTDVNVFVLSSETKFKGVVKIDEKGSEKVIIKYLGYSNAISMYLVSGGK
jgi:hypothetical protein